MNGVFVVAGATGAIGRSLCHKIVANRGTPLLVGRSLDKLERLQSELGGKADISIVDGIDFATAESTQEGVKQLSTRLEGQPIQGIAYAVGSITLKPLRACQTQDFLDSYQLNVLGAASLLQATLPSLKLGAKEFGDASMVMFSSIAASRGLAQHAVIGASKGAVEGLTKSLAAELSAQKIRVNCVAPSLTGGGSAMAAPLTDNERIATTVAAAHPIARLGTPEDSANAAAYLLSSDSSWTTGAILPVDGGRSTVLK
mmetsp:Transcript_12722/g.27906  ORF Transcript_12722/g.27906 Transcript_12722/m.27906 type:complete len:257 (-) Transcript_12722:79-849(-)|eukprot:CAMPEP_0168738696 /NCGR_PEP_ID=MMETSP0724-20121128/11070_1 /TAXON_ID=265536 /ORGANISM="Amphiprora sp., Strain CCMP467" /LENGTH=256 /DNA_ID=CAMNT_0008786055 /DNA_START=99 /DNA_END=869 /DNA_ORIENTATION=-